MFQRWQHLTFLHWRYRLSSLAIRVPPPLEVETFDGSAWIGITPFLLTGLRLPYLPPLPWLSAFPETNCRTYVRGPDGRPGVWFFSLDADRAAAVFAARLSFGLPYVWSSMRVEVERTRILYDSRRHWPFQPAATHIEIEPAHAIRTTPLEEFLTARYRLYSFIGNRLSYTQVEHPPWPLFAARVLQLEQSITLANGLPRPAAPVLAHYSPGATVRVAPPRHL